ncbi:MAG: hypothetical protein PHE83_09515 [Opitutaceae bacterium]|nr:hypothetical protein [Opitutaceae bacterium]
MKESKFIELLNLYVDQQISPAEATQLEEEIMRSPQHRRTYHQYCKMHRACALIFENSRAHSDQAVAGVEQLADQGVAFEPRPRQRLWGYYAAGMAAAAGLALVAVQVLVHPAKSPVPAELTRLQTDNPAARPGLTVAAVPVRTEAVGPRLDLLESSFVTQRRIALSPSQFQSGAPLILVRSTSGRAAARPGLLAEDSAGTLLNPSIEQFVFEQAPSSPNTPQSYRARRQLDGQTEMTAFQFQR